MTESQDLPKKPKLKSCCDKLLDEHIESGAAWRQHVMLGIPTWQCPVCKTIHDMRPQA